ncbi:hypothetical protein MKX03_026086, partial [Papaver bracteatum]
MEGVRKRKSSAIDDGEKKSKIKQVDVEERAIVVDESKSLPEELWIENILTRLPAARTLARCSL